MRLHGKAMWVLGVLKTIGGYVSKVFGGMSWLSELFEKHKLNVHLKIIVSYVQVLGSFVSFNVEWPSALTALMSDIGNLMQFNAVELPKLACLWAGLSFERTLIFTTAGPLAIAFLLAVPVAACRLTALCRGWTPERRQAWEAVQDRFYSNLLFGAFLIYPISSLNCLQAFNCHQTLGVIMGKSISWC